MNLNNQEIRDLREIMRRFRTTNGLNKLVAGSNASITNTGCHITTIDCTCEGGSLPETDHLEFYAENLTGGGDTYEFLGIRKKGETFEGGGNVISALYDVNGNLLSTLLGTNSTGVQVSAEGIDIKWRVGDGERLSLNSIIQYSSSTTFRRNYA